MLPGRQAQPGAKLGSVLELLEITHRDDHGRGAHRPHAYQLRSRAGLGLVFEVRCNAFIAPVNVFVELFPLRLRPFNDQAG